MREKKICILLLFFAVLTTFLPPAKSFAPFLQPSRTSTTETFPKFCYIIDTQTYVLVLI